MPLFFLMIAAASPISLSLLSICRHASDILARLFRRRRYFPLPPLDAAAADAF